MLMEIIIHPSDVVLMLNHLDLLYSPIEVWSNKTLLHLLFLLQTQAIRIIHKAGYFDHTNTLFYQYRRLKLKYLVDFYSAPLLNTASRETLPCNIQEQFLENEGGYKLKIS